MVDFNQISLQTKEIIEGFLEATPLRSGQILVVGCSTSEVQGERIGSESNLQVAHRLMDEIYPAVAAREIFLAVQCCEHLNRALVVEQECAERYGLVEVCVLPHPKGGGSMATVALKTFRSPVVVEAIWAHGGIDIGDTFIGMHILPVGVPLRLQQQQIGNAHVTMIKTRPKLIGGERAQYPEKCEGKKWEDWKAR